MLSSLTLPATATSARYSTIAYLAGVTKQIKLGLQVTCNTYRHPGLLVKIVSTIDVLSGGRAFLGIGAGWFEREAKGLGIPFPSTRERIERLEETLQIVKLMWGGQVQPYHGKYYQLAEPINSPPPLSQPHPPILIGASGEKKMLRLVAQYADAWNYVIGSPLEEFGAMNHNFVDEYRKVRRKLAFLRRHCDRVGRSFDDIDKTITTYIKLAPGAHTVPQVIDLCRQLAKLGIHEVILNLPNVDEVSPLKILGNEVIPIVKDTM